MVVGNVTTQQGGPGFESTISVWSLCVESVGVCVEFACCPRVCVGYPQVLRLPPTMQRHAINGVR